MGTPILDHERISRKLDRLAIEVLEHNYDEQELVIGGIASRGALLAQLIYERLQRLGSIPITLLQVKVDKENLLGTEVQLSLSKEELYGKVAILCDDVLYTGKTLSYAAIPFMQAGVKKLQCLVLVHRHHIDFPVQPTFIGMSLANTLKQHVDVNLVEPYGIIMD